MHAKTDSDSTGQSLDTSGQFRSSYPSSTHQPLYYVQSPSHHDILEKMSSGSSPIGSPALNYYQRSSVAHSWESTSRNNSRTTSAWRYYPLYGVYDGDKEGDGEARGGCSRHFRRCLCWFLACVLVFTSFCLILWGVSRQFAPEILVKNMVFLNLNVQAGNDQTGVPTELLSLNSTVKIHYKNPAKFFAVRVTSTPLELYYLQLKLGSGQMEEFSQSWKSQRTIVIVVQASQIPLYGGVPLFANARDHVAKVSVPLNLTFVMRSRAYVLGRLVKSKFYKHVRCPVTLSGNRLGKPLDLTSSCEYD